MLAAPPVLKKTPAETNNNTNNKTNMTDHPAKTQPDHGVPKERPVVLAFRPTTRPDLPPLIVSHIKVSHVTRLLAQLTCARPECDACHGAVYDSPSSGTMHITTGLTDCCARRPQALLICHEDGRMRLVRVCAGRDDVCLCDEHDSIRGRFTYDLGEEAFIVADEALPTYAAAGHHQYTHAVAMARRSGDVAHLEVDFEQELVRTVPIGACMVYFEPR